MIRNYLPKLDRIPMIQPSMIRMETRTLVAKANSGPGLADQEGARGKDGAEEIASGSKNASLLSGKSFFVNVSYPKSTKIKIVIFWIIFFFLVVET